MGSLDNTVYWKAWYQGNETRTQVTAEGRKGRIEDGTPYGRTDGVWAKILNEALGDVGKDQMENKRDESVEEECKGRTRIYRRTRERWPWPAYASKIENEISGID